MIENAGKSQSCMVSKLPIIWKQVRDLLAAMGNDVTVSFTEKGTVGIRFAEDTFTGCVVVVDIVENSQVSSVIMRA